MFINLDSLKTSKLFKIGQSYDEGEKLQDFDVRHVWAVNQQNAVNQYLIPIRQGKGLSRLNPIACLSIEELG